MRRYLLLGYLLLIAVPALAYQNEAECFPVAPSQPVGISAAKSVNGRGGVYIVTAWRQPCPQAPGEPVLMLKFQSVSGAPQVSGNDIFVLSGGTYYGAFFLHKSNSGGLNDQVQVGPIGGVSNTVVQQSGARFDASARLYISFVDAQSGTTSLTLDPDPAANPAASVGVAYGNFSDMWWDPAENGTGMSIIHHSSNQMFILWYTYSDSGEPLWIVFPGGTWSGNRTFTGALYHTTGTSFRQVWNPTAFQVGSPVGNGTITIVDADHITFTYALSGSSGTKTYTRQRF